MYISQVFSAKSKRVYAIVCAIVLLLLFQGAFQENNNETENDRNRSDRCGRACRRQQDHRLCATAGGL